MVRLLWLCRRATVVALVVLLSALSGCIGDGFVAAAQDIRVKVLDIRTKEPVPSAIVSATRLSDCHREQLSSSDVEMLDYLPKINAATAVTNDEGVAVVPLETSGPYTPFGLGGVGPDQVTGRPVGFRIEAESSREYLVDHSTEAGDHVTGEILELEVQSIGSPRRNTSDR